jgi:cell pole-organizing protein PopZ
MFQATGTEEQSTEVRLVACEINNALAQTILVENARTLQDLVREMLRPMLKSWLDDNLPTVVERLVLPRSNR